MASNGDADAHAVIVGWIDTPHWSKQAVHAGGQNFIVLPSGGDGDQSGEGAGTVDTGTGCAYPVNERGDQMPVRQLKEYLDNNRIKYVTITHSVAYTTQEIASIAHVPGKELAKAVLVLMDNTLAMAVLPATRHIDLPKLGSAAGAKTIRLASDAVLRGVNFGLVVRNFFALNAQGERTPTGWSRQHCGSRQFHPLRPHSGNGPAPGLVLVSVSLRHTTQNGSSYAR
jgi:hypothetical protein